MNRLDRFVCSNNNQVDYAYKPASIAVVGDAERILGVKIGKKLRRYLLKYGYLGFGSIEFYGIIQRLGLASDMVRQTRYLHVCFPKTKDYIALGTLGGGVYILVDSVDLVYTYDTIKNQISLESTSLYDYMLSRLLNEGKGKSSD